MNNFILARKVKNIIPPMLDNITGLMALHLRPRVKTVQIYPVLQNVY